MSLARYRYFYKVARLGSIRAASEVLHVAPSAISRQIARLEDELGVDLIEANGRGIRITPAGEILAGRASQIVDAVEQVRSDIDDLLGLRRGHVRIRTVEGSLNDLVLVAMARFQEKYPAVTFELSVTSSDRIVAALLDQETDLGVVFNPPNSSELDAIATVMDSLYAIVHPQHAGLRRRGVSLAEVAARPLALPDETFGLRHMIDAAAKAAGVVLAPVMITDSIEALRGFARAGIGIVLLPKLAVASDLARRVVKAIPLIDRGLRNAETTVLALRGRSLPIAVRRFGEQLIEVSRSLARSGYGGGSA
jgi:DNA-binding transcriptional LysR family regulator